MQEYFVMAVYALISSFGLYKMKANTGIASSGFVLGLVCYGTGFAIWLYILKSFPLSVAFPVAAGSLIITTQIFGVIFLKEPFDTLQAIGILLILAGVLVVFARR